MKPTRAFQIVLMLFLLSGPALAERLPISHWSMVDGLPSNSIGATTQDRRGFLWIATPEGLARFDGKQFVNFGKQHGLPSERVVSLKIDRHQRLWVGTMSGLAFADLEQLPSTGLPFTPIATALPADTGVMTIAESPDGTLWFGTSRGLYRLTADADPAAMTKIDLSAFFQEPELAINRLAVGPTGDLLLYGAQRKPQVRQFVAIDPRGQFLDAGLETKKRGTVTTIAADSEGFFWFGVELATICRTSLREPKDERCWPVDPWHNGTVIDAIAFDGSLRVLIATRSGVASAALPLTESSTWSVIDTHNGLTAGTATSVAFDRNETLWIGTPAGLAALPREGFESFDALDGVRDAKFTSLSSLDDGRVLARGRDFDYYLMKPDQPVASFEATRPAEVEPASHTGARTMLRAYDGSYWLSSEWGLLHWPAIAPERLATTQPERIVFDTEDSGWDQIFTLFEDRDGGIWVSRGTNAPTMGRYDPRTRRLYAPSTADVPEDAVPTDFAETSRGTIWAAAYGGTLYRRRGGTWDRHSILSGNTRGMSLRLLTDSAGRLWIATSGFGVARCDTPEADHPNFVFVTRNEGLASDRIYAIAEDRFGRLYLAMDSGVDRLTPASGRIEHLGPSFGMDAPPVKTMLVTNDGTLWLGGLGRLFKLVPKEPREIEPSPVVLSALKVAGRDIALPLSGSAQLQLGSLAVDDKNLQLHFTSPALLDSSVARYQVRFQNEPEDWSAPSTVPALQLAQLAPGRYDLQVRASSQDGKSVSLPATLQWTLPAPIWRRWWFLGSGLAVIASIAALLVRQRVQQLLAVERLRSRIASDLHDEIGASLTHIALLSDMTKRQAATGRTDTQAGLDKIATVARELVDSMSDIVWSINPKRDRLSDLVGRLRWFATELAEPKGLTVTLDPSENTDELSLNPDTRRALYLISKEAIHNAVKHSGAHSLSLGILRKDGGVQAQIADDGKGFEATAVGQGNGLINMRQRATAMGGSLEVHSTPGKGTRVVLFVPLTPPSQSRRRSA